MKKKLLLYVFGFTVTVVVASAVPSTSFVLVAHAQTSTKTSSPTFTPEVPIPGVFDKPTPIDSSLAARYIRAVYIYFIWVVGLMAVAMVIFGGIKWVSAAGNPGAINDARATINNAIIGLIIALTSVTLLNIINPDFIKLQLPDFSVVQTKYVDGAYVPQICNQSLKVDCGQMLATNPGKNPLVYCLGAKCNSGYVCSVDTKTTSDGKTSYVPALGCINSTNVVFKTAVSAEAPLSYQYTDISGQHVVPVSTMKFTGTSNGLPSCGYASAGIDITSYCPKGSCYMTGTKAQFPTNPIDLGPVGTVGAGTIANNFNCTL